MPLDSMISNIVAHNIRQAKRLIDTPDKHLRGDFKIGHRMCSANAVAQSMYGRDFREISARARTQIWQTDEMKFLNQASHEALGYKSCNADICQANNHLEHPKLMAVFDRAIQLAELGHPKG